MSCITDDSGARITRFVFNLDTGVSMEPDLIPASEMKNLIPGTTDQYWATLRHKGTGLST